MYITLTLKPVRALLLPLGAPTATQEWVDNRVSISGQPPGIYASILKPTKVDAPAQIADTHSVCAKPILAETLNNVAHH